MIKRADFLDDEDGAQPPRVKLPSFLPDGGKRPSSKAKASRPAPTEAPATGGGSPSSASAAPPAVEGAKPVQSAVAKGQERAQGANTTAAVGLEKTETALGRAGGAGASDGSLRDVVPPETLALLERLARQMLEQERADSGAALGEEQIEAIMQRLLVALREQPELLGRVAGNGAAGDLGGAKPRPQAQPSGAPVSQAAGSAVGGTVGASLADGVGAVVGAGAAAVGGVLRGTGMGLKAAAEALRGRGKAVDPELSSVPPLPLVLPRVSEYRIAQVESAVTSFEREQEAFWRTASQLDAVRAEMKRLAKASGVPIQDIAAQMRPGGEFASLRAKFDEAVRIHPETRERRKAMDKAIESFVRQFGRASEEVIAPDIDGGSPHFDALKRRLEQSKERMLKSAANVPAFETEAGVLDASYWERLQHSVAKIVERIKEVAQEFLATLRSKRGIASLDDPGP